MLEGTNTSTEAANKIAPSTEAIASVGVNRKTVAEFFAGIGLMRMGLERRGWSVCFANDIDPQKYGMYKEHFADAGEHFVVGDVHLLSAEEIPAVTLATASFPCNDLSLAGARRGLAGSESSAFWGFTRRLDEMGVRRPPMILLENVTGFLTSHGGSDFKSALLELNRLGYKVDAFTLNAASFVPQSRDRLFIVGVADDRIGADAEAERLLQPTPLRSEALARFIAAHQDEIAWSLRDLPPPPRRQARLEEILEDLTDESPEWWSAERAEYLLNQMSPRHREIAERMIAGDDWSYGTVFRRMRNQRSTAELRTDSLAGCLRTPRGGSGRQILFRAGKGRYHARLVTPREAARLMGADDFTLPASVTLNQALFGFGDAVCVPAVEWISEHYLDPIADELYKSSAASPIEVVREISLTVGV